MSKQAKLDQLRKVLRGLEADNSDEKKLSSLYIVSKVIESENQEHLNLLFTFMNFKFLDRLIKQGINTNDESKVENNNLMNQIGINILSHMFSLKEQFNSDILLARVPLLMLHLNKGNEEITKTILDILYKLSKDIKSCHYMLQFKGEFKNSIIYMLMKYLDEQEKENKNEANVLHCLNLIENVAITLKDDEDKNMKELLSWMINKWQQSKIELKLNYCETIVHFFNTSTTAVHKYLPLDQQDSFIHIQHNILLLLNQPFQSRHRDQALILSQVLIKHYGFYWLKNPNQKELTVLLIRIAAVEVRSLLETIDFVNFQNQTLLASSSILNNTVYYLQKEEQDEILTPKRQTLGITGDKLGQILLWLKESYQDVMYFIVDFIEYPNAHSHPLLLRLVNDLCTYLIQDCTMLLTKSNAPPIEKFINFLIEILKSYHTNTLAQELDLVDKVGEFVLSLDLENDTLMHYIEDIIPDLTQSLIDALLSTLPNLTEDVNHNLKYKKQIQEQASAVMAIEKLILKEQIELNNQLLIDSILFIFNK